MDDDELKVYGRLRKDSNFINQLVDLYKELQQANMTVLDLQHLDQAEKQEDLVRIFSAAQDLLLAGDFDNQSKLSAFFKEITSGHLDKALSNTVLVIDGFTRFSAEEEALVTLLMISATRLSLELMPVKRLIGLILSMAMFIKLQWIF